MDSVGEFLEEEIDGKPYLVFHQPKYQLPQIDTPSFSSSSSSFTFSSVADMVSYVHKLPIQPRFTCPTVRILTPVDEIRDGNLHELFSKLKLSHHFCSTLPSDFSPYTRYNHYPASSLWSKNENTTKKYKHECSACFLPKVGTDYYFCGYCDEKYHKECVESPLEIKHPSHSKHSLQLYFVGSKITHLSCISCRKQANTLVYYCASCNITMHVLCAQATIPIFIDKPKTHHHTLTLSLTQPSLFCNVCGLIDPFQLPYVCSECDFVAHSDCIYSPRVIRISRHPHPISLTSSLPSEKWSCGVCRQEVDSSYGAYACNKCSSYVVHTRCALRNDVFDGKELEGVLEEDDIDENVESFKRLDDETILHFSHDHNLTVEKDNGVYDEHKVCEACILPICGDNFYSCIECEFFLHEICANAPYKKQHPLHPHPLTLKVVLDGYKDQGHFVCVACDRGSCGFVYECPIKDCFFQMDMRCASITEPFEYQGHQHPLFLALKPEEKPICQVCKSKDNDHKVLNCIECDFVLCFKCATLPYKARCNHDEHYLTFCHGDEARESDWCESCKSKLAIEGNHQGFYKCNDCCKTLHISCILGSDPYMKYGRVLYHNSYPRTNICGIRTHDDRPICKNCKRLCPYKIVFFGRNNVYCSTKCLNS